MGASARVFLISKMIQGGIPGVPDARGRLHAQRSRALRAVGGENVKAGIAFIRGMRMFGSKNYTKAEVMAALGDIEGKELKILDVYNGDIVVFMKCDIHYATVGSKIEKCLEKHFGGRFYVTTRAFSTVENMVRDVKGKIMDDP